jgi:hypothetical protein
MKQEIRMVKPKNNHITQGTAFSAPGLHANQLS